jgi:NADH-quinone oxidoreductase subunit D
MYANWAYCRAVERLAGIRVPERAEYLRAIVCEMQRIASHMMSLGSAAADTGAATMFIYAFDERERIVELFEELCGARLTYNYVRPGGVSFDVPEGWVDTVLSSAATTAWRSAEMDRLFFGNVIARGRMKGVGVLSAEDAVAWGASGPVARGSGVNWDLRKHDPYSVYPRLDFDVRRQNGDATTGPGAPVRVLRVCRIIEQAISQMEPGPIKAIRHAEALAPRPGDAYDHIESRAARSASTSSRTVPCGRTA